MSCFTKPLKDFIIKISRCLIVAILLIGALNGTSIAATAITRNVTNISYTTATGNGTVSNPIYVNAYGVCWNTTGLPTMADSSTNGGYTNVNVDFSHEIKDLIPGTTYFVRAYAREWFGSVSYGDIVKFTTKNTLPIVTTQPVTDIGTKTAKGHGTIVDLGISDPEEHGVCWNRSGTPTIEDKKTEEGEVDEVGEFTSEIKGLKSNRTYYVRAYATNSEGTAYGNEVKFTTSPSPPIVSTQPVTDIEINTATANGTIEDIGAPNPTQHGFCWNTTGMPDLEDKKTQEGDVNQTGPFSSIITELLSSTTYYVRAYATNSAGTSYGDEVFFTTLSTIPTVTTEDVTDIGTYSATGNGTITDLGIPNPSQHGVCWNTTGNPSKEDEKTSEGAVSNTGAFTSAMSGLAPATIYYVKAYATNDAGTAYGDQVAFKTDAILPQVSTDAVTKIATHSADGDGTIIDLGIPNPHQHGVCWNTSGNPSIEDSKTEEGPANATGEFNSTMEGLLPDTTYFIKAYASNAAGTAYGNEASFKTAASTSAPIATLSDIPAKITNATSYAIQVGGIGVVSYRYRVDADDWSEERPIGEAITFQLYGENSYTLSVVAKNELEMWQDFNNPTTITWTIDKTPPQAEIYNYPAGISNSSGAKVTVGGVGVVSYRYRIDGGEWSSIAPVRRLISLANLVAGEHTLEVIGADYANNWQEETNAVSRKWINDLTIPTAVLQNIPSSITNQTTTNIEVTFSDNGVPIDAYAYTIDDGHTWWSHHAYDAIELSGLSEGDHTLCVNAFGGGFWQDGLDGMSSTDNATCIHWRVDVTPANPAVLSAAADISPAAAIGGIPGTVSVQLSWIWTSDDEQETIQRYRIWYAEEQLTEGSLDNAAEVFCDLAPGIQGFEEAYSISGLIPGKQYFFSVKSIDTAGNISDLSNIVDLTPEDHLPKISIIALTEGGLSTDNAAAREFTIKGENFLETAGCNIVRFENESLSFDFVGKSASTDKILADIPMGSPPGIYLVRVINRNGISAASSAMITITAAETPIPVVTDIRPFIVEIGVKTELSVMGENFDEGGVAVNLLSLDGVQTPLSNVVRHDSQTLTAVVDIPDVFLEGRYHVQVINSNGGHNEVSAISLELCRSLLMQSDTSTTITSKMITIENGAVPVVTNLITDNRNEVSTVNSNYTRINLFIEPGSSFEIEDKNLSEWLDYTGPIRPPRQVPENQYVMNALRANSVIISMGIDESLRLKNGATMFVMIETTLPSGGEDPSVYHLSSSGDLSLAGVDGEWRDLVISKGGTVLAKRLNTPEEGMTTYTIGLLLDSMSDYVIGARLFDNLDGPFSSDHYGSCFIEGLIRTFFQ